MEQNLARGQELATISSTSRNVRPAYARLRSLRGSVLRPGTIATGSGAQTVATAISPNGRASFLGEFGGPAIVTAPPYDPRHFVRVDEAVTLTLHDLKPHTLVTVAFDLYILKSWDGNNQTYGPDRWALRVQNGQTPLDTTFSNNPKTGADLSQQNYPVAKPVPV